MPLRHSATPGLELKVLKKSIFIMRTAKLPVDTYANKMYANIKMPSV
jgi:hypothetical protein